MADITRKAVRKRINLPNGSYVYIPVLERIPFSVAADQYQERVIYVRNGSTASRTVRIREVPNLDNSEHIQVERIERLRVKTMAEQAQETDYYLKNLDPPPVLPDGTNDPAHERVHYVRYFQNNDVNSDAWVDVELIDTLKATVAAEQYQEWRIYLKHDVPGEPINDPGVNYGPVTIGFCDPALELAEAELEIDPPYRLDPFQNIIQFNSGTVGEAFDAVYIWPLAANATPSGWWSIAPNAPSSVLAGHAVYVGGSNVDTSTGAEGIGHIPNKYQLDMRFVDQVFGPRTYDPAYGTGGAATGDVIGYTQSEWIVGYSPSGAWWDQLQNFMSSNPGVVPPNYFDYYFSGFLTPLFNTWRFGGFGSLIPVVIVRMVAIGSITSDNPAGRY